MTALILFVVVLVRGVYAGTSRVPNKLSAKTACNLKSDLSHLNEDKADYPRQAVSGPMQADEMLTLFSLIRTSSVRRVLEVGGFHGDSAFNFLQALRCKRDAIVITVDLRTVKQWTKHAVTHRTLQKDASNLTMADVDGRPVDAILLDCHAYYATKHILHNVLSRKLLAPNGFIFLHDTGLHSQPGAHSQFQQSPRGYVHQPVERLIAQWLVSVDCSFQRISAHDDTRADVSRHGLTIMQVAATSTSMGCQSWTSL